MNDREVEIWVKVFTYSLGSTAAAEDLARDLVIKAVEIADEALAAYKTKMESHRVSRR